MCSNTTLGEKENTPEEQPQYKVEPSLTQKLKPTGFGHKEQIIASPITSSMWDSLNMTRYLNSIPHETKVCSCGVKPKKHYECIS